MRKIVITAAALAALALAGCTSTGHASKVSTAAPAASSATVPATPAAAPAPTPSPDGTFSGSCDYTLGSDPVGGTAVAIGEIDLKNTGNVGTRIRVKITWPQEGYAPLAAVKHVKVPGGGSKAVRFHLPIDQDQIERLQSWQEGHDFKDGCTYHSTITDTFGAAK